VAKNLVKKDNIYWLICVFVLVFSMSFLSAADINDDIHLNIQTTNVTTGAIISGTFNFQFDITIDSACSSVVYTNSTTLTTDSRGIVSYYLENVDLAFDQQYYLCYYRDSVFINSSKIARTPYTFRAQNVTMSGVEIDSNLDMTGYNVTADYFIGDGSLLTNINVGAIDLSDYVPYAGSARNVVLGAYNFSIDSSKFFFNVNTGRLGIGTTTPGYALDVVGSIYASSDVLATGTVQGATSMRTPYMTPYSSGGNFDVRNYAGDTSYLSVNTTSGNVGIGTTSPANALDIVGNLRTSGNIDIGDASYIKTGSSGTYFDLIGGGTNEGGKIRLTGGSSTGDIQFYTGGAIGSALQRAVIDSSGKVGINNTNPAGTLDVVGTLCLNGECQTTWAGAITGEGGWNDTGTSVELVTSSDNVSAGNLFVDNSAGYVGIGTSSPGVALDVSGTISASSNVLATTSVQTPGYFSVPTITPYSSGGNIDFKNYAQDTTVLSVNTTSGNVGIGTTSPEWLTHLSSNADTRLAISGDIGGTTDDAVLLLGVGGTDAIPTQSWYLQVDNSDSDKFIIGTRANGWGDVGDGDLMTIDTSGNVGIGTTSPTSKLHVNGSAIINGTINMDSNKIISLANGTSATDAVTLAQLQSVNSTMSGDYVPYTGSTANVVLGAYNFSVDGTDFFVNSNTGNIGIGTTSPGAKFEIRSAGYTGQNDEISTTGFFNSISDTLGISQRTTGASNGIAGAQYSHQIMSYGGNAFEIYTNAGQPLVFGTDETEAMRIIDGGNVGIGTTSPDKPLHVVSGTAGGVPTFLSNMVAVFQANANPTSSSRIAILGGAEATSSISFADDNDNNPGSINYNHLIDSLSFRVNAGDRMTILNNGNVGIGTTSPQNTLNVIGDGNFTGSVTTESNFTLSQGGNIYNNGTEVIFEY